MDLLGLECQGEHPAQRGQLAVDAGVRRLLGLPLRDVDVHGVRRQADGSLVAEYGEQMGQARIKGRERGPAVRLVLGLEILRQLADGDLLGLGLDEPAIVGRAFAASEQLLGLSLVRGPARLAHQMAEGIAVLEEPALPVALPARPIRERDGVGRSVDAAHRYAPFLLDMNFLAHASYAGALSA